MKITLAGYGKMGRLLEKRLIERGHEVVAIVDPYAANDAGGNTGVPEAALYASLEEALKGRAGKSLKDSDAVIEFTAPDAAAENLLFLAREKIPTVTGTTGWYEKLPEVTQAVLAAGTSLVWSSNFSLGVNLFFRIAARAAKLMDPFAEYDAAAFEVHHNKKADSPSGTAKTLAEIVLANMTRKKKAVYETLNRKPDADEFHCASLRAGSVPGTHSLIFDSSADTIEITHTARNREGLASGAVLAAEWLAAQNQGGRARSGVFTVDDVLADLLPAI